MVLGWTLTVWQSRVSSGHQLLTSDKYHLHR